MGVRKTRKSTAQRSRKHIAFAKLNDCPTSPRKMRLMADLMRGNEVEKHCLF
jgi:large subunit ribosomal protein L22